MGMPIETCREAWYANTRYPTECSGPPHLLGPWGRPVGNGRSGLLEMPLLTGHHFKALAQAGAFSLWSGGSACDARFSQGEKRSAERTDEGCPSQPDMS